MAFPISFSVSLEDYPRQASHLYEVLSRLQQRNNRRLLRTKVLKSMISENRREDLQVEPASAEVGHNLTREEGLGDEKLPNSRVIPDTQSPEEGVRIRIL